MNEQLSSKQVYDAINSASNTFFNDMCGSAFWRTQQDEITSGAYNLSGIQVSFRIREWMKPDGTPMLPQTQINPTWLSAGSYFVIVEIGIPNEDKFSIQAPHNKPENQIHLQKGREKIILHPPAEDITNYDTLCSGLFLKFHSEDDAIAKIQEIRLK